MKEYSLTKQEKKKHIVLWLVTITLLTIFDPLKGNIKVQIFAAIVINFYRILIYYALSLFILPRWFEGNKLMLFVSTTLLWGVFLIMNYISYFFLFPKFNGFGSFYEEGGEIRLFLSSIYAFLIVGACSFVLYLNKKRIIQLNAQNEKEKNLLNSELIFLKDQFNNHLTYNFLNFCYRHLYQKSEIAANSIETYSDILNYALKALPYEQVPLQDEVDYIENFIDLQKLLSKDVFVNFNHTGTIADKLIIPQILISFVEKAFTNGEISYVSNPIDISLNVSDKQLLVCLNYQIKQSEHEFDTQKNIDIKEILKVFYPNKFKLETTIYNTIYSDSLTLAW